MHKHMCVYTYLPTYLLMHMRSHVYVYFFLILTGGVTTLGEMPLNSAPATTTLALFNQKVGWATGWGWGWGLGGRGWKVLGTGTLMQELKVSLTTPQFSSHFSCAPNWARFCPNRHHSQN